LNFDLALAQEQSAKNPVYYVQYAQARICSILRKMANLKGVPLDRVLASQGRGISMHALKNSTELNLIRQLIKFPEIIEETAGDYQVQRLPYYSLELANSFHKFYEECRVLDEKNKELSQARLSLVKATQIVLKDTLKLMGISAPEKM